MQAVDRALLHRHEPLVGPQGVDLGDLGDPLIDARQPLRGLALLDVPDHHRHRVRGAVGAELEALDPAGAARRVADHVLALVAALRGREPLALDRQQHVE